jgi:hypothetical protein
VAESTPSTLDENPCTNMHGIWKRV